MARKHPNLPLPEFRLLLDQGFPLPSGFDPREVDRTITVTHLHQFDASLSDRSVPDWALYCLAAEAGFDALVTRDKAQTTQAPEMYVLTRLSRFTVITWRKAIEDPIREWGQLLAYLPLVRRKLRQMGGMVLLLPAPTLTGENVVDPKARLVRSSETMGMSQQQLRAQARTAIRHGSATLFGQPDRFSSLLGHRR